MKTKPRLKTKIPKNFKLVPEIDMTAFCPDIVLKPYKINEKVGHRHSLGKDYLLLQTVGGRGWQRLEEVNVIK